MIPLSIFPFTCSFLYMWNTNYLLRHFYSLSLTSTLWEHFSILSTESIIWSSAVCCIRVNSNSAILLLILFTILTYIIYLLFISSRYYLLSFYRLSSFLFNLIPLLSRAKFLNLNTNDIFFK